MKRAPLTFTLMRKALAKALQCPEVSKRVKPHMLARVRDGTVACMLLASLTATHGTTWHISQHTRGECAEHIRSTAAPPQQPPQPSTPASHDVSYCTLIRWCRAHIASLIAVRNLAEVRDILDSLESLLPAAPRPLQHTDAQRTAATASACDPHDLFMSLFESTMCDLAKHGQLPFVEMLLKRIECAATRTAVLQRVLIAVLPPVQDVLASTKPLSSRPTGRESDDSGGASRSLPNMTEGQGLRCCYSAATIERVLMSCACEPTAEVSQRLELLVVQEISTFCATVCVCE